MAASLCPDAAEVDQLLLVLQSPDNAVRSRAEGQLEIWCQSSAFLHVLMARAHHAPTLGSRQLAATVLSWRIPRLWSGLTGAERQAVLAALLECFSTCGEAPVLRALGEACNAACQAVATRQDLLWEDLLRLVARLLPGSSVLHRRAALELLAALVDSVGGRLQGYYAEIGHAVVARVRDEDDGVKVAAIALVATAVPSWCLRGQGRDLQHWQAAADTIADTAAAALARPSGDTSGPRLLTAALRALTRIAPTLRSRALSAASVKLACHVLSVSPAPRAAEHCRTQALQLLRALARAQDPELLEEPTLGLAVRAACGAAKDAVPDLDDINEVSVPAQAARECVRALARAHPAGVLPLVLEVAHGAAQSADALDRAAAVHSVAFALGGARDVSPGWAVPLARAMGDATVWVRQAAYEGASALAEALRPSPAATEGLLVLLLALAERLPREPAPELLRAAAAAVGAVLGELSTDEVAPVLRATVTSVCHTLSAVAHATGYANGSAPSADLAAAAELSADPASLAASAALVALLSALGAAATTAADHFAQLAQPAAAALLPVLRAGFHAGCQPGGAPRVITPAVLAACLDAAGALVASAWADPAFRGAWEELGARARQVLADAGAPSEVRASAHHFFSCVATASFEEFAPQLPFVVEAAVGALQAGENCEVRRASGSRRAVRTGGHEERVAAIAALGAYAVAVGPAFAAHLPAVLPVLCAQAQHTSPDVRVAVAGSLERVGRMLGSLAGGLPEGSPDRAAGAAMARATAMGLCDILAEKGAGLDSGAAALRTALQAKEDLAECSGFVSLLAPEVAMALAAAGGGRRAEDVESSEGEAGEDLEDDDG